MRFSSKPMMGSSELYYYGYRFYDPSSQRWLNRDPLGEEGGVNLYGFARSSPVNAFDPDGRKFVYEGEYAKAYQTFIDCWKKLPNDSFLGNTIRALDTSPRAIRIKGFAGAATGNGKPMSTPQTIPDSFDTGTGRDTTTYIDLRPRYVVGGRMWTFKAALAHEMLHAFDDQTEQTIGRGTTHSDPGWIHDELRITQEADKTECTGCK
jgi:RHS repeat-associated protein